MSNKGAKALAEGLKSNTILELLDLGGENQIKEEGGECMAEALKCNTALTSLDLSG